MVSDSADGITFHHHTTITDIPEAFGENSIKRINFGNMEEANDNPDFKIRINFDGASHATGNNRIDNICISDAGE